MKKEVQKLTKKYGLKIKIAERAGKTVKSMAQKSDPYPKYNCEREDCVVCHYALYDCRSRGCVYGVKCIECDREYIGQTGRSIYERAKEHQRDYRKQAEHSALHRHSTEFHEGEEVEFRTEIRANIFGKPTRRRITEAVHIGELRDDQALNNKTEWTYVKLNKVRTA